jgi:hypothetical protein
VNVSRPEATPLTSGSLCDDVSVTVPRIACAAFAAAGSSIVAFGGVRSSSHVKVSGVASMFAAASTARMSTVCVPSAGVGATVHGPAHELQLPPSMRHSKTALLSFELNVNWGAGSFVGSGGFVAIVVFGSVRSTVTAAIVVAWWPTASRATALRP